MDLSKFSTSDLEAIKSKDLSKVSDQGLMLLKEMKQPKGEQIGKAKAALTGFEQSGSFGLAPYAAGVGEIIGAGIADVEQKGLVEGIKQAAQKIPERFKAGVQDRRNLQQQSFEQQPLATTGGAIGASLLQAPALATKSIKGALGIGAVTGGLEAAGSGGDLKDIGTQAAISGALNTIMGPGGSKVVSAVKKQTDDLTRSLLFKVLGAKKKDVQVLLDKPFREQLIEKTIQKFGLAGLGDKVDDVFVASKAHLDEVGQKIGAIYDDVLNKITDAARLDKIPPETARQIIDSGFKPQSQAKQIMQMLEKEITGPGSSAALGRLQGIVDDIAKQGDQLTPQEALRIKGQLADLIDFGKKSNELPIYQQGLNKIRSFVSDKINKQVELIDNVFPSGASSKLKELNQDYSALSDIHRLAKDKVSRETANRFISLPESLAAGGVIGGTLGPQIAEGKAGPEDIAKSLAYGALTALGGRGLRRFGPGVTRSLTQNVISPVLGAASEAAPAFGIAATRSAQPGISAIQRRKENANNR